MGHFGAKVIVSVLVVASHAFARDPSSQVTAARAHFDEAKALINSGSYAKALAKLEQARALCDSAAKERPEMVGAWMGLAACDDQIGLCLHSLDPQKNLQQAVDVAERGLRICDRFEEDTANKWAVMRVALFRLQKSRVLASNGELAAATKLRESAIAAAERGTWLDDLQLPSKHQREMEDSTSPPASRPTPAIYRTLAEAYCDHGQFEKSRQVIRLLQSLTPEDSVAYVLELVVADAMNDRDGAAIAAVQSLLTSREIDPGVLRRARVLIDGMTGTALHENGPKIKFDADSPRLRTVLDAALPRLIKNCVDADSFSTARHWRDRAVNEFKVDPKLCDPLLQAKIERRQLPKPSFFKVPTTLPAAP